MKHFTKTVVLASLLMITGCAPFVIREPHYIKEPHYVPVAVDQSSFEVPPAVSFDPTDPTHTQADYAGFITDVFTRMMVLELRLKDAGDANAAKIQEIERQNTKQ